MKYQIAFLLLLLGCLVIVNAQIPTKTIYGIDGANRLVVFSSTQSSVNRFNLQGILQGEIIRGIAFSGGNLWGVSSNANRVFQIDVNTHQIKNAKFLNGCFLSGSGFGTDFAPNSNILTVISNTGQNLRINVNNGNCNVQSPIVDFPGDGVSNPKITGAAYGPGGALFVIDYQNDVLGRIQSGNVFRTIGDLHFDTNVVAGFDIFTQGGHTFAWATLAESSTSGLFSINLNTGRAHLIKFIPGSRIGSIAVSEVPTPPPPPSGLCISAAESTTAIVNCPAGTINILNAFYGTPKTCPNPAAGSCNSGSATSVVRTQCNGKVSCNVVASNSNFGDPCVGTVKTLAISFTCVLCSTVGEGSSAVLNCPAGKDIFVTHAFYGTPSSCPNPSAGSCNSGNSLSVARHQCNGKTDCTIEASNTNFGDDPCEGTVKSLSVRYTCN